MEVATTPAPLSITLDATLSGSTSNNYLTMATALQIAANMPGGGDWIAADEELRNLSLIQATRWLETLNYKGDRCKSSQRLKWPRNGAVCDGVTSDCSGIPYPIQEAEVALAVQYNSKPGLFPGGGSGGSAPTGVRHVKRRSWMFWKSSTTSSQIQSPAAAIPAEVSDHSGISMVD